MKSLNPDCPLASQASHRRSPIHLAVVNRATAWFVALLLVCVVPSVHAGNLGRLFFTPEQRAQLDFSYARDASNGNASPVLTVNGIVQKNGGARTVWVNGVAQSAANSRERTPTAQTVAVPGSHPVKLKVGEKILLDHPVTAPQDVAPN